MKVAAISSSLFIFASLAFGSFAHSESLCKSGEPVLVECSTRDNSYALCGANVNSLQFRDSKGQISSSTNFVPALLPHGASVEFSANGAQWSVYSDANGEQWITKANSNSISCVQTSPKNLTDNENMAILGILN